MITLELPGDVVVVIFILFIAAICAAPYFLVIKPLERKYLIPWIWRRVGGKGRPPNE